VVDMISWAHSETEAREEMSQARNVAFTPGLAVWTAEARDPPFLVLRPLKMIWEGLCVARAPTEPAPGPAVP
jgi:hypothetical protein